jgi:hypothetical protein
MLVALEVKLSPRAAHALDRDQYFSLGILVVLKKPNKNNELHS